MITKFLYMSGYGLYVWMSFSLVLLACAGLYLRTKKILKKYENEFASELNKLSTEDKKVVLRNSKIANQILVSQDKTI
jgi:heme exporter protein D